ncbi:hypothetical protein vseg_012537 [Gypsophila vaccaria]
MMSDEIDWDNFDFFADASPPFTAAESSEMAVPAPAAAAGESWAAELEDLLMKDDDDDIGGVNATEDDDYLKEFDLEVCDLLLEFPEGSSSVNNASLSSPSPSVENGGHCNVNVAVESNDKSSSNDAVEVNNRGDDDHHDDDDPLTKKRKRQSSNREAAMRSRERKKLLVKDLEMKSRYFEDECRRLQRLLHCCYAENQWLRCSLQTYGAPMTKPESAVLLLESLLLGSLVWLMVNICLLPQSKLPLLHQGAAVLVSAVPRGKGTKRSELWISLSFTRSKKCRASRTKMKSHFAVSCF